MSPDLSRYLPRHLSPSRRGNAARRAPGWYLTTLLALAAVPCALTAQSAAPPAVLRAQGALQAGRADSAIATLEAFFAQNPQAVAGRLLLAAAYRQRGDTARALSILRGITQPRPMRLQAMFNAAAIHARRGDADSALKLLRDLKGTGAFDVEQARTGEDFATLRRDPRFESVMFRPEDFAQPFVEPVRVLHEFVGETRGDQFSWIARGLGDVDGDGVSDVVTSAPTYRARSSASSTPSSPRGRVYVYSGKTGRLLWTQTGAPGDNLGTGLEGAGDVNGDGAGDVIAGAPGGNRAYVYSGRDGRVLHTLTGRDAGEGFGRSVSGVGDQDGDGVPDLLIGAPSSNAFAAGAGRVYLVSGRLGTVLYTLEGARAGDAFGSIVAGARRARGAPLLVGAPGSGPAAGASPGAPPSRGRVFVIDGATRRPRFIINADSTGAALGAMFTSLVGDVNGDGVADVYASDFADGAAGPATGKIYIHSGVDGALLLRLVGERAGDGFGVGSADLGDINRDGYDDLIVGAWQYSRETPSGGRVYIHSGRDGALLRTITGRVPGETLGFDATGIGDVDGDGIIDLLITSSWSNVKGFQSGRMYIISGAAPGR